MIWDPDEDRRRRAVVDTPPDGDDGLTVKERIEALLAHRGPTPEFGGWWWSLADVQDRIRGSSVRSRMQDIMRQDRDRPAAERRYEERDAVSRVGKATFTIYRRREAGVQSLLFDVPATRPWDR